MDETIYTKLRAKADTTARVFNAPSDYPKSRYVTFLERGQAPFVHMFAASRAEFLEWFPQAERAAQKDSIVWVSYKKGAKRGEYDINRDSLWDLLIERGWHPVAQVSLDAVWSAVRIKPNEAGKEYVRPSTKGE